MGEGLTLGEHGSTFAGGPICARAALAALEILSDPELLDAVRRARARSSGRRSAATRPSTEIRGRGLMIGVAPRRRARFAARSRRARSSAGVVVNAPNPETIRLLPPLTIGAEELAQGLARLREALDGAVDPPVLDCAP